MPTALFLCLRHPSNQKSWLAHSTLTCAQNAFLGLYPDFAPWLYRYMTVTVLCQMILSDSSNFCTAVNRKRNERNNASSAVAEVAAQCCTIRVGYLSLSHSFSVISENITMPKNGFFGLHFSWDSMGQISTIVNITQNSSHYAFKVINFAEFRYQLKARVRLPMCQ